MMSSGRRFALVFGLVAAFVLPGVAEANHSWGGYHWARQSNPFTLKLGDNVSSTWDPILATTSSDWTQSTVLNTTIVAGQGKGNCRPTTGRVEVCDKTYGYNGWLGQAQIWLSSGTKHIVQGAVKLNDSYMNNAPYNTTAWRNLVSCQEVGHTLGLDHQDTNFNNANLGTCMDYTNNPSTNQHPNKHDYDELVTIYTHLDSTTTVGQAVTGGPGNSAGQSDWGQEVARTDGGHTSVFVKDLGAGASLITFVLWIR